MKKYYKVIIAPILVFVLSFGSVLTCFASTPSENWEKLRHPENWDDMVQGVYDDAKEWTVKNTWYYGTNLLGAIFSVSGMLTGDAEGAWNIFIDRTERNRRYTQSGENPEEWLDGKVDCFDGTNWANEDVVQPIRETAHALNDKQPYAYYYTFNFDEFPYMVNYIMDEVVESAYKYHNHTKDDDDLAHYQKQYAYGDIGDYYSFICDYCRSNLGNDYYYRVGGYRPTALASSLDKGSIYFWAYPRNQFKYLIRGTVKNSNGTVRPYTTNSENAHNGDEYWYRRDTLTCNLHSDLSDEPLWCERYVAHILKDGSVDIQKYPTNSSSDVSEDSIEYNRVYSSYIDSAGNTHFNTGYFDDCPFKLNYGDFDFTYFYDDIYNPCNTNVPSFDDYLLSLGNPTNVTVYRSKVDYDNYVDSLRKPSNIMLPFNVYGYPNDCQDFSMMTFPIGDGAKLDGLYNIISNNGDGDINNIINYIDGGEFPITDIPTPTPTPSGDKDKDKDNDDDKPSIWDKIKDLFSFGGNSSGGIWDWLGDLELGNLIRNLGELIKDLLNAITDVLTLLTETLPQNVIGFFEVLVGWIPPDIWNLVRLAMVLGLIGVVVKKFLG